MYVLAHDYYVLCLENLSSLMYLYLVYPGRYESHVTIENNNADYM